MAPVAVGTDSSLEVAGTRRLAEGVDSRPPAAVEQGTARGHNKWQPKVVSERSSKTRLIIITSSNNNE